MRGLCVSLRRGHERSREGCSVATRTAAVAKAPWACHMGSDLQCSCFRSLQTQCRFLGTFQFLFFLCVDCLLVFMFSGGVPPAGENNKCFGSMGKIFRTGNDIVAIRK